MFNSQKVLSSKSLFKAQKYAKGSGGQGKIILIFTIGQFGITIVTRQAMKSIPTLTKLIVILLLFTTCSGEEEEPTPFFDELEGLSDYERDVVEYFREIALGFEFGGSSRITRKWVEPMRIFIGGEPTLTHQRELQGIVNEINGLATDGFEISIVDDSLQSNYYVFMGSYWDYRSIYSGPPERLFSNWGLGSVWWDENNNINRGMMYVDTERANNREQLHLLREELTQTLGLGQDSGRYAESIFQQEWTRVVTFTEIDRDLIRFLYHPKMTSGLNHSQVLEVLKEIFEEEGI